MSNRAPAEDDRLFLRALGVRLRTWRARRGMTRKILARRSGISERYISAMEVGAGNGSILLLRAMAATLNIDLRTLLEDEPPPPDPTERLSGHERRIALIGLRGAGKSTLGPLLAEKLAVPFVELDREIEREAGLDLGAIMELHGQAGFRRMERTVLDRTIAAYSACVIAAGGGIVAEPGSYAALRAACVTVWVRATPEDHMRRVTEQGDLRPMHANRQAMADLRAILDSREALYAKADHQLETSGRSVTECVASLIAIAAPADGISTW